MPTEPQLRRAASAIRRGELVGMPTETVYGLGCDAFNQRAVAKVFELKARPRFDPLIVHAANRRQAWSLVSHVPESAKQLAQAFWPGPLTLVLPKAQRVSDLVTSGRPTVAVRVPSHTTARRLIEYADRPIAAPSANRFGRISPTTAKHVADSFAERLPIILDGGPCTAGVESTVISMVEEGGRPTVLRFGGLSVEQIQTVVGELVFASTENDKAHESADADGGAKETADANASPGMSPSHYAPNTPLIFVEEKADDLRVVAGDRGFDVSRCGVLAVEDVRVIRTGWAAVEVLSDRGDLTEAAANLFAAMHRLDDVGVTHILALPAPERGLGRAINDRLRRAAAK